MSTSPKTLRIAHISDLHISRRPGWREMTVKRFIGFANFAMNRGFRHNEELVAHAVERLAARPPDVVIATGDLAQTGLKSEFRGVEEILSPLTKAGTPVIICDGNHDRYGNASHDAWLELRARLLLDTKPNEHGLIHFPRVEIFPMDQGMETPPLFSYGRVEPDVLARAQSGWKELLPGSVRIVCGHYPVMGKKGSTPYFFYGLKGWRSLLDFMRQARVSAYLCGHYHRRFMIDLGGGVVQYVAPALSVDGRVDLFDCRGGGFDNAGSA